jgi:hypothetical protein
VRSHAEKLLLPVGATLSPSSSPRCSGVVEVVDFGRGSHPGPTIDRFCIDAAYGIGSGWNARACQVFAYDFCSAKYPEAIGKTHVDASYEFYRLLPSFLSRHAAAAGFGHPQRLERFHELFARQVRKQRVRILVLHLKTRLTLFSAHGIPRPNCKRNSRTSRLPPHCPPPR